jgi:hypothetical protein
LVRIDFGFGRGLVEIGVGTIVDDEAELLWEVWGEKGMWELDFVWVGVRLRWDFLEGKYEVEELFLVEEFGFMGAGLGLGLAPFEKGLDGFLDSIGADPGVGGGFCGRWIWFWLGDGHGSRETETETESLYPTRVLEQTALCDFVMLWTVD